MVKMTYFLDVVSSWCHYFEPTWDGLKNRYADKVEFQWRIALIPASGLPSSGEEEAWYYRRSGMITRQATMLNTHWIEPGLTEYLAPNLVAVALKRLGENGDEVRRALTQAALLNGEKVGQTEVSMAIASKVSGRSIEEIESMVNDPASLEAVRSDTEAFYALQVDQRPAFFLESEIGDGATFSGLVHEAPLVATLDAMIEDCQAYRAWNAHFGQSYDSRIKTI